MPNCTRLIEFLTEKWHDNRQNLEKMKQKLTDKFGCYAKIP